MSYPRHLVALGRYWCSDRVYGRLDSTAQSRVEPSNGQAGFHLMPERRGGHPLLWGREPTSI